MNLERPQTRGDCLSGPRPCPWVSCRYHLWPSVSASARPENPLQMAISCCLDVADKGEHILEEVGTIYGVTRERIRQIEAKAIRKLRHPSRLGKQADELMEAVAEMATARQGSMLASAQQEGWGRWNRGGSTRDAWEPPKLKRPKGRPRKDGYVSSQHHAHVIAWVNHQRQRPPERPEEDTVSNDYAELHNEIDKAEQIVGALEEQVVEAREELDRLLTKALDHPRTQQLLELLERPQQAEERPATMKSIPALATKEELWQAFDEALGDDAEAPAGANGVVIPELEGLSYRDMVITVLEANPGTELAPSRLAELTGAGLSSVTNSLTHWKKLGRVDHCGPGLWQAAAKEAA